MKFVTHSAVDVDDHAARLAGWKQRYDQIQPGRYKGSLLDLRSGSIRLFRERANCASIQTMSLPNGQRHVLLPLAWPKATASIRAGYAYLLPTQSRFRTVVPANFDVLCVSFSIYIEHHLPRLSTDILALEVDPRLLIAVKRQWTAAMEYCRHSGELPSSNAVSALRRLIQDGLTVLLEGCGENQSGKNRRYCSRRYIMNKCHELMCRRTDQPPTVMELCRELRISRRTLQYSFESEAGVSPVQYLRSVRLNAVRRDILRKPSAPLADLAAAHGFFHPSYFSRTYSLLFGELPSETRKKSRT